MEPDSILIFDDAPTGFARPFGAVFLWGGEMDWQTIFNTAGAIATVIVGGYVRFVQAQLNSAREAQRAADVTLTQFQIKVAENYVTHSDLRRIEDALVRIEAKIDVKADK